jgi:hypothetical protein
MAVDRQAMKLTSDATSVAGKAKSLKTQERRFGRMQPGIIRKCAEDATTAKLLLAELSMDRIRSIQSFRVEFSDHCF